MSKNHGAIRIRNGEGKIIQIDNPNWRKKVNNKRDKEKRAKKARKKNR